MFQCPYCMKLSESEREIVLCKQSHLQVVSMRPHYTQGQLTPTAIYVKMGDGSVVIFEPCETFPCKAVAQ